MMRWECNSCKREVESDPTGHSDWGGKHIVSGPHCDDPECLDFGLEMTYIGDESDTEPEAPGEGG